MSRSLHESRHVSVIVKIINNSSFTRSYRSMNYWIKGLHMCWVFVACECETWIMSTRKNVPQIIFIGNCWEMYVCHNLVVITLVTKNIHNRVKWLVARLCSSRPSRHSIFPSDLLSILIQFREALADFFVLLATKSASQIVKFEGGKEIPLSTSWLIPRPEPFAWENQFPPPGCKLYCSTLKEEKLSRAEDGYNFRKL